MRSYERLAAPAQTKLDFRSGSKAEVANHDSDVRFTPESGSPRRGTFGSENDVAQLGPWQAHRMRPILGTCERYESSV